ncbi:hypothetical protein Enr13x_58730 [Stieleria neptunia]|uniref:Major Facilitator Superfamily protein n=1 Tax=Stieleria neptunia TaxID=2527979 RepID=A0A518HYQ0_9BACT|nr:DUF5690 family protein [Stieleria neptunia]QDV45969.1 hypothetical protein Enr13x_58730 [Stieleria neptunia]
MPSTDSDIASADAPSDGSNPRSRLLLAAVAAFCTYFCMYAFRKPFTAGTYEGQELLGMGLKSVLVISQLAGYMISKFVGIRVVSEMPRHRRAIAIVGLILTAELALVGFAYAPLTFKAPLLFLNGFPLGMVFGLVLAYLEGRKQTEALSAALCASFIISSGVVKSIGRWVIQDWGVSEFQMPMLVGLIFLVPLLVSVWLLQSTPPPDQTDRRHRSDRDAMTRQDRSRFWMEYWPGLSLLIFVYVALTVIRTVRDDFAVEIWRDLGVGETPSVFARSEIVVALLVTVFNAFAVWIRHNMAAVRIVTILMCGAFAIVGASAILQSGGLISPFMFMVSCGVGMYVPYVAFHTTVFERLVAASRHPANVVFLMYVADAVGYLGYAVVLSIRMTLPSPDSVLPSFRMLLLVSSFVSVAALCFSLRYFRTVIEVDGVEVDGERNPMAAHAEPVQTVEAGGGNA